MKLRTRLLVSSLLVVAPVAVASLYLDGQMRRRADVELMVAFAGAQLEGDARARCEADPAGWSRRSPMPPAPPFPPGDEPPPFPPDDDGPLPFPPGRPPPFGPGGPPPPAGGMRPPPILLFPFDQSLHRSTPRGPELAPALIEALRAGASAPSGTFTVGPRTGDEVLLRTPWGTGPCAHVLVRRGRPPFGPGWREITRAWALPVGAVLLSVLLAMSPVVSRIRRLSRTVRASSADRWRTPVKVEGSDEVAELARAFDEASGEVRRQIAAQEAREQTLRDFLASTTHDVMTPLTVLQGHLATLERAAREGTTIDRATLSSAMAEAHYTSALLHNLGVAARLEAGEPHLIRAPVDLTGLVERVVSRHRPLARQREVELERAVPEDPLLVEGDETFLEQAIGNVVTNAVRHNHPGGHVAVVLEREADSFRLRVIDDGPGIPLEERERVLERSVRGDAARTRDPDGRGLGLAITRQVVELHGWSLRLGDAEEGGLLVEITPRRGNSQRADSA